MEPVQHPQSAAKLRDHVRELVMRLLFSAIALVVAGTVIYFFYTPLLELLRSPLGAPLYYSTPAGSFAFVMKICFMGALVITIPILIYNLIMFVQPAFEKTLSRKRIYLTTITSSLLAIAGAVFAFTCILPGTLHFFAGFQIGGLNALISADSYLSFVTNIVITFVLVFQLPLLITFIDNIKPLKPKKLFKMEKWVVIGSLVIALLAPFTYDLVTSLLIALPIIVLYNLSIAIVLIDHIRIAHKARVSTRAKIAQPVFDLVFDESTLLLENFIDELDDFKPPTLMPNTSPKYVSMDIIHTNQRPAPVVPAEWVHRLPKQITLSSHVRLISDISRKSNVSHVLTSQ